MSKNRLDSSSILTVRVSWNVEAGFSESNVELRSAATLGLRVKSETAERTVVVYGIWQVTSIWFRQSESTVPSVVVHYSKWNQGELSMFYYAFGEDTIVDTITICFWRLLMLWLCLTCRKPKLPNMRRCDYVGRSRIICWHGLKRTL